VKIFRGGIGLLLALLLALPVFLALPAHAAGWKSVAPALATPRRAVLPVQYYRGPPRLVRPRRTLPPRLRGMRPPAPPPRRPRDVSRPEVRIQPSEALRLAQRRWPRSIGLSVRLLNRANPVYAVKLKAGSRVLLVLVDARTGRVLQ